jgi:hypothetical protein
MYYTLQLNPKYLTTDSVTRKSPAFNKRKKQFYLWAIYISTIHPSLGFLVDLGGLSRKLCLFTQQRRKKLLGACGLFLLSMHPYFLG